MAKSLKEKVEEALKAAVGEDAHIELEEISGKLTGLVLSSSFSNQTGTERQDHIWKYLDEHLSPFERTRIVFIIADTPEEYEALKTANSS